MRATAISVILLLSFPAASALLAPTPDIARAFPALPDDITDAEVLTLLGAHRGMTITRLATPATPADLTLGALVTRLATRVDQTISPTEAAAFDALDVQLQAPILTLLLAIEEAWNIRDTAFASQTPEQLHAAHLQLTRGELPAIILTPADQEAMLNAAIMLSDTIENIVIPQLQNAANADVWPAIAVADPVGILRIGGTGNDLETVNRLLQIDARGDDTYRNNAGGTTVATDIDPRTPDFPIAVSIDLSGNDWYDRLTASAGLNCQGGAFAGIGILYELGGNDRYDCRGAAQGGGVDGIGILRETTGNDYYGGALWGKGAAFILFGYLRDDAGNDEYRAGSTNGGYGEGRRGTGLFWDRGGTDTMKSNVGGKRLWGYADGDADGWYVQEGPETDTYIDMSLNPEPHPKACDNCTWTAGDQNGGQGNDNAGGLAYLLAYQRT